MLKPYKHEGVICAEGNLLKNSRISRKIFSFIVDGLVIDTGPYSMSSDFTQFYQSYFVDQVVLTHSHEDHSGNASWFANQQIPIFCHRLGVEICSEDAPYPLYRQKTWGARKAFPAYPLSQKFSSRQLDWEVIETPGHADDHVALFCHNKGIMFTGDLYVQPHTKIAMDTESIPEIIQSIKKLLTYDFEAMFCSHSGYFPNGKDQLRTKLNYLEDLSGKIIQLYLEGKSVLEIKQLFFPKHYQMISISNGEWDTIHIVTSIINGYQEKFKKSSV